MTQKLQKSGEVQGVLSSCEARLFTQKLHLENEQDFGKWQLYPGCLCIMGRRHGAHVWAGLSASEGCKHLNRCVHSAHTCMVSDLCLQWQDAGSAGWGHASGKGALQKWVWYHQGSSAVFRGRGNDFSQGLLNFLSFSV